MTNPTLLPNPVRQVLACFERSQEGTTLSAIARELKLSPGRVESLVDFWVRKGRLRVTASSACASCGSQAGCYLMGNLPRIYELVREGEDTPQVQNSPPIICSRR